MKILKHWIILVSLSSLIICPCMAREISKIVNDLSNSDFSVRQSATLELEKSNISNKELTQLIDSAKDPETKSRLMYVWSKKNHFTSFKSGSKILSLYTSHGKEANGSPLYVVRTRYQGKTYIGKYSPTHAAAYFAVGAKELTIKQGLEIFTGKETWLPSNTSNCPLVCGKTKSGKKIYAVRTSIGGGTHIGMLIEGEKKATFPYGGRSLSKSLFEVLQE